MNSREKGKRGELELAHTLTDFGFPARRGQQFQGGADSPDIVCEDLSAFHIECKRVEVGNPYRWLKQAQRDAGDGKTPIVMHRKSNEEWVVVLALGDFLKLVSQKGQPNE